jgi:hypothetical protein
VWKVPVKFHKKANLRLNKAKKKSRQKSALRCYVAARGIVIINISARLKAAIIN